MASSFQVQAPEFFNFSTPNEWPRWKKKFERFRIVSELDKKEESAQIEMLMYLMGDKADDVFRCLKFALDGDKKKLDKILESFDNYFKVRKNVIYERALFNSRIQEEGEPIDDFITHLYHLAESCDYGILHDDMIRDRIVVGVRDRGLSEKLQLDEKLTLEKAVTTVRQHEAIRKQQFDLNKRPNSPKINQMKAGKRFSQTKHEEKKNENRDSCSKCGRVHYKGKPCPALESTCRKCDAKGHWESCCRANLPSSSEQNEEKEQPRRYRKKKKAATVKEVVTETSLPDAFMLQTNSDEHERSDHWMETIKLDGQDVKFKLDTGADVTAVPFYIFRKNWKNRKLLPSDRTLRGSSGKILPCAGMFKAKLKYREIEKTEKIYVIYRMNEPLLSGGACEILKLVVRMNSIESKSFSKVNPKREFPELFEGIGKIGSPYKIRLKKDVLPFAIHTPRRVPIPLMEKLKARLEDLEKMEIIQKMHEATEWCAPTVIASKANGDIRLCVDLSKLNDRIERELHPMPVVEHMLGQLGGATFFSKLDANSGFHQIPLEEESQKLTTFITPFGRYSFKRMPFGISLAPEYFQRTMMTILQGEKGVICYLDDILIFASSQEEHDTRLRSVLMKLKDAHVTLNEAKCTFGVTKVDFLGHIVDGSGIRPDPKKIEAVAKMPPPTDVSGVRRFLGMINHLGRFVENLSEVAAPLNALLVKDREFYWGANQEFAFERLKEALVSHPILAAYDVKRETLISSDASSYGLGAVLKQKDNEGVWRPVAYASRTMTAAEKRYAQIEKEALALTWACERFQDFLLGRNFLIETDHKPLIPLFSTKELDVLTPRLQRFRMRMMRFGYAIYHIPGKDLIDADTLSRQPLPSEEGAENEEDTAGHIKAVLSCLPIKDERLAEIFSAQQDDPTLQKISDYIVNGWPEKKNMPRENLDYWHVRDEISISNGLMMRGCRLIIPARMQKEILERLHTGHFGVTKTRLRARETVWWPGISEQIAETVRKCSVCIQEASSVKHETMILTDFPVRPWQKLGMDLFKFEGKWFLVVIDYYSRYPEVVQLQRLTAEVVVNCCKSIFARHGIPEEVMSDNGTQFGDPIRNFHPGAAREFANFAKEYGFRHITSSPRFPQSNGMAEAGVKILKKIFKKNTDPSLGLLEYRATPLENGYSPAELLMGRKLRTTIPSLPENLNPKAVDGNSLQEKEGKRKRKMKDDYDRHHGTRDQEELSVGDTVWIVDLRTWGAIKEKAPTPRSYMVETPHGIVRRNRFHLRKGYHLVYPSPAPIPDFPEDEPEPIEIPAAAEPVSPPNDGRRRSRYGRLYKSVDRYRPSK